MKAAHLLFLLLLIAPLAYAIETGGNIGIQIHVTPNSTDNVENIDDEIDIYHRSYVNVVDAFEREENYAYPGEEVVFEVYVTGDDKVEELNLVLDDNDVECKKRNPELDDGQDLPDQYSDQAEYDEDKMDYYKCSFIVDKGFKVRQNIKIEAVDEDDSVLERSKETWNFNQPIEVDMIFGNSKVTVQNKQNLRLEIDQEGCGSGKVTVDESSYQSIDLGSCADGFISARII